ncbi:uncharacterized protein LOC106138921 [Amyelois transitella]|uniref:uncharacterized protein LOC106138921 n=1 Tax=Amyelois transitella TaxID=680683 RepID=UPI0029907229|nr:uncharacterized protein LOC106138921 [Amyelois transitella]
MNELLQKHGCSVVFSVPEGLKELMSDITREVLREQPEKIYEFITNYLSVLILTREHGLLAVKLLDELCDCRPTVSEHLLQLGLERDTATILSEVIKEEIEVFEPAQGKEKVREMLILKNILTRVSLDEDMAERVCQVSRNAYRDYWYRKKLMEQALRTQPEEPWQIAAERTLEIYKKTRPSYTELNRATQKIQSAYRGYYVRKNLLRHLKLKPKKTGPKVDLPGPPIDIAASRTIELGPVITLNVVEDNVMGMYERQTSKKLGLQYDPMKTITHVNEAYEEPKLPSVRPSEITRKISILPRKEDWSDMKRKQSIASHPTTTPASSVHRISFAGIVNIDFDVDDDDDEPEIPEDIAPPLVEIAPEVPDEAPNSRSDGDGRSTPSSAPASTPRGDTDAEE